MPTAFDMVSHRFRDPAEHRAEWLVAGLEEIGYTVRPCHSNQPGFGHCKPEDDRDILLVWTKSRHTIEAPANAFEQAGGRVVVCEESHFKGMVDEKIFSLCLHDHNGAGTWPEYGPQRWKDLGLELKPWREEGDHILLCGQRGIGSTLMASPMDWHLRVKDQLTTERPIKVRAHPKSRLGPDQRFIQRQPATLDEHLVNCWAVVVWSSGAGTKALMDGIPVFYDAPRSFLAGAASKLRGGKIQDGSLDDPNLYDRLPVFERLAWSQWRTSEIVSGEAFVRLLG